MLPPLPPLPPLREGGREGRREGRLNRKPYGDYFSQGEIDVNRKNRIGNTRFRKDVGFIKTAPLLRRVGPLFVFLMTISACGSSPKDSAQQTIPPVEVTIPAGPETAALSPSKEPEERFIYIPIGRLADGGNEVKIQIDGAAASVDIVKDEHSGSWYKVPVSALNPKSVVSLNLKKKENQNTYQNSETDLSLWLKPSKYIDTDNPKIIAKAEELTRGLATTDEKVIAILNFELTKMKFKLVAGWAKDFKTASQSLADGYGICMNYSRVFVALSRASGIPARLITGSVIGDDGMDGHHDWAEYYDPSTETWYPVDPLSGNGKSYQNIRFIDLIYNTDDNSMFPFAFWEEDRAIVKDGYSVLFPIRSVHWETGHLGYRLIESHLPEFLLVQVDYPLSSDYGI